MRGVAVVGEAPQRSDAYGRVGIGGGGDKVLDVQGLAGGGHVGEAQRADVAVVGVVRVDRHRHEFGGRVRILERLEDAGGARLHVELAPGEERGGARGDERAGGGHAYPTGRSSPERSESGGGGTSRITRARRHSGGGRGGDAG